VVLFDFPPPTFLCASREALVRSELAPSSRIVPASVGGADAPKASDATVRSAAQAHQIVNLRQNQFCIELLST